MSKLRNIAILLVLSAAAAAHAQTPQYTLLARLKTYPRPYGGLVQGRNGQLYSTTAGVNAGSSGQVFEISTSGTLKKVAVLPGYSEAGLVLATNGNFYGTTLKGGQFGAGKVFKVSSTGKLTTLYSFCAQTGCPDGDSPLAPLIQASDGSLYGTTRAGGAGCNVVDNQCGTVFKMSPTGKLTTLYIFCLQAGCLDGAAPQGALLQASDGNLYGTTIGGGGGSSGTVFRITTAGQLTTLYSFCTQSGCPDGKNPVAGVVEGPDSALYGTTQSYSKVYRITLDGTFQVLHEFCSQPGCPDGFSPDAPLIVGTDGNLYGTTASNGPHGYGTIFSITTSGALTTLYGFCASTRCSDGAQPYGPLFQATDGNFYGTTFGATNGAGDGVYRLEMGLAPFVTPVPAIGKAGRSIQILGTNLTGATAVTFNGSSAASFAVDSTGSSILAKVPAGATTGSIQVTLANGTTLSSNVPFQMQ